MNFVKTFRTLFLQNTSRRLLLNQLIVSIEDNIGLQLVKSVSKAHYQFVVFKPLSYYFKETIGVDK